MVHTDYGLFQLALKRDARPEGGYVLAPQGEPQSLPLQPNVVRAYRPLSEHQNTPQVSVNVVLPVSQQQRYSTINFLVSGNNRKTLMYANYDDGQGGTEQVEIYESPGDVQAETETGFYLPHNPYPVNPDLISAFSMKHRWEAVGGQSQIANDDIEIWTLAQPLPLDSARVLRGFTLAVYDADTWKSRTAIVYAAAANRVNAPALSSAIKNSAISEDGTSVVSTFNARLQKLDASGNTLWSQSLGVVTAGPLLGESGSSYVGTANGQVHALSAEGEVIWTSAINGAPVGIVADNRAQHVLVVTKHGVLNAYTASGDLAWSISLALQPDRSIASPPSLSPMDSPSSAIFVTDSSGALYAIARPDSANGTEARVLWVR